MIDRIPTIPPVIMPTTGNDRPQWSVMIPVYNCGQYLEQTILSVLAQDRGLQQMQIEVVDDASTDVDVAALVKKIAGDRISVYRQPQNVGSLRNFETCINRAKGQFIHILHGDDFTTDGYYKTIEQLFTDYPSAGAAFTGFTHVDENGSFLMPDEPVSEEPGILVNWLQTLATGQKLQPVCIVVKREVYESLGSFFAVHYGEDWEMWTRIAAHYPVAYHPAKLACYRVHKLNITGRYLLTGQHIKDIKKVIDIIQAYLPIDQRKTLKKIAERNWSRYFARTSDMIYAGYKSPLAALRQSIMAFQLSINKTTVAYLLKTSIKVLIGYKPRLK